MRRNLMSGIVLAVGLFAAVAASAAEPVKQLEFGVISTESSAALRTLWEPFFQDMAKAINIPIRGSYVSDYAGVIEGMRFNKVQVAWMSNASGIEAVDRSQGEVFAHTVKLDGTPGYYSLLIVNKDSPIKDLNDLLAQPGKFTFGNGDPNSTSGFLVPGYYVWAQNKIDIRKFFTRTVTANHETNGLAVANKQVDVATNNTENLTRLQETNPEAAAKIRVIWQSPLIGNDPMVWRKDLPDEVKTKIRDFIFSYGVKGTPEEIAHARDVLKGLKYAPFEPADNTVLNPIRKTKLYAQKIKIENDDKLSEEEKKKSIAPIEEALSALDK